MVTPLDVQKKQFNKALNGYNRDEVDDYLTQIANALEKHINENIELREKLDRKEEEVNHYKNIERTMADTLVVAKQSAEDLVESAKQKSSNLIEQAELTAQGVKDDAASAVAETVRKHEQLERDLEAFRLRIEAMLRAQLDIVANYSKDLK